MEQGDTRPAETEWFATAENDSLIARWGGLQNYIKSLQESMGRIEWELTRRMQADGAVALHHPDFDVKLAARPSYDHGKLAALREVVPQDEINRAYVPAHEVTETVPGKWDMRVALTFKKFGREAKAILDRARIEGAPRISIKAKEGSNGGK